MAIARPLIDQIKISGIEAGNGTHHICVIAVKGEANNLCACIETVEKQTSGPNGVTNKTDVFIVFTQT